VSSLQAIDVDVRRDGKALVEGISLSVVTGEVLAVIGPNGAGKSTLLAALAGDCAVCGGQVLLDGRPLGQYSKLALARRRTVLPQSSAVSFDFTALQVATLGLLAYRNRLPERRLQELARQALAETEALDFGQRPYTVLSGGERQRVQLARVLAQCDADPSGRPFLLLDEPVTGLDLAHQHAALRSARRRADRGVGVLAVLHDLNMASQYADRVAILKNGRLVALAPTAAALDPDLLSTVFATPIVRLPAGDGLAVFSSRGPNKR
jgi:iron complex transport system ATP-binding protein